MGCCSSIPHSQRRYRDPGDLDEVIVPLREFGNFRNGTSNLVPDDIDGLPSTHIYGHLASNPDTLLYEAEIDHGQAYRFYRFWLVIFLIPSFWLYIIAIGINAIIPYCTFDKMCCWLRKEYSTRTFFRVFPNRIEVNNPKMRVPFGFCGCGSWSADEIQTHPFDRGAFGFRSPRCCVWEYFVFTWPIYGGVVARQRCQCNGSLWPRLLDCGGWWCDEWLCDGMCCSYRYFGLADADETAFAAGIALQAYYEGRKISRVEMDKCVKYWRENLSEMSDPEGRKRDVCCEPFSVPFCSCACCYKCNHHARPLPYDEDDPRCTPELIEVYANYENERQTQLERFKRNQTENRGSTICKKAGCRRVFGRRGFIFCTEGCGEKSKKKGDPAPLFQYRDIDDDNDASVVLQKVLGDPPSNVRYQRYGFDEEKGDRITNRTNIKESYVDIEMGSTKVLKKSTLLVAT